MKKRSAITFIHSLFRSGSTYFFEAIRKGSPNHACYQEALHEIVLANEDNPQALILDRNNADDKIFRHPPISSPYYSELVRAWPAWRGHLDRDHIFKHYFRTWGQSCGHEYWLKIASSSHKPAVFEETRTTGKIGAIKSHLRECFCVYLLRNPWDQWFSYKCHPYFDATILAIINSEARPTACHYLAQLLGVEQPEGLDVFEEISFYQDHPLPPAESYKAFYLVWTLSLLEALEHADLIVQMDRLNVSSNYRAEVCRSLQEQGIELDLGDFCLGFSIYTDSDLAFFEPLEAEVLRILKAGGWSDLDLSQIRRLQEQIVNLAGSNASVYSDYDCQAPLMARSLAIVRDLYLNSATKANMTSAEMLPSTKSPLALQSNTFQSEKERLEEELTGIRLENERLETKLRDACVESEALMFQLHQLKEELEHYYLDNQRKDEKLRWLRGQRDLLLRMLRLQGEIQQRFIALNRRIALPSLRRLLMPWWYLLQRS